MQFFVACMSLTSGVHCGFPVAFVMRCLFPKCRMLHLYDAPASFRKRHMWICALELSTKMHERDKQFRQVQERIENTYLFTKEFD